MLASGHRRSPCAGRRLGLHATARPRLREHVSMLARSRGHASPLPPRCRPAWTADQEVRREEPAVDREVPRHGRLARADGVLRLPEKAPTPRAADARSPSTSTSARAAHGRSTTFYDTFDGRLHGDGVTLRHADGRLALLDRATGDELAAAERATAARGSSTPTCPDALRERLADVIEMRALLPVARVRARELAARGAQRGREDRRAADVETHATPLRGRVTATAVRGYDRELERVSACSPRRSRLPEATVPLVDEAVVAAGGDPAGTSAKLDARARRPTQPADARGRDRLRAPARGDRRQPARHARRRRLRVPARPARRRPPHALAAAPVQGDLPASGSQHFRDEFKRLQAVDRRPARPRRLPARLRRRCAPRCRRQMRADLDPLRDRARARAARAR